MADGSTPEAPSLNGLVGLGITLKSIDIEKRRVDFIASTDAVDTYDEIVDQASWELDKFKANPVILFAHNSRALPIGKAVDVGVKNGRLECTIEFATEDANPEAEKVWKLIQGGFLRAVSVGFIPTDYKWEKRDGKEVFVLYGNSLREISVTPVPANHEALAKMRARAMAERSADTKDKAPPPASTENNMDEATKKALEAKDAELKAAGERLEAATKALAEAGVEAAKAASALETANKAAEALKSALGCKADESLEDGAKRVVSERDALAKEKADLTDKATERDVDDLIGKKITPAQKDDFLGLAKKDRASFDSIVKGLPDLGLTSTVVDPTKGKAASDDGDLSDELGADGEPSGSSDDGDFGDEL